MKLESLKLEKFKSNSLKREQMFKLSGGDTRTNPGTACEVDQFGRTWEFDYAYDAVRTGGMISLHGRTNRHLSKVICDSSYGGSAIGNTR